MIEPVHQEECEIHADALKRQYDVAKILLTGFATTAVLIATGFTVSKGHVGISAALSGIALIILLLRCVLYSIFRLNTLNDAISHYEFQAFRMRNPGIKTGISYLFKWFNTEEYANQNLKVIWFYVYPISILIVMMVAFIALPALDRLVFDSAWNASHWVHSRLDRLF